MGTRRGKVNREGAEEGNASREGFGGREGEFRERGRVKMGGMEGGREGVRGLGLKGREA